jgi:predicted 3-demethylubiquinone-9 3-methyltransferase (glyoxalase superfamily)
MQEIVPHLGFYVSVFKNSKVENVAPSGQAGAEASEIPGGTVMTIVFRLEGHDLIALNGGLVFTFSPAISFLVNCTTQEEVDELWERLSEGGEEEQRGWLRDKCGVSWQIVPTTLGEMLQDKDQNKSESVMKALLQMKKIDIAELKRAYERG